MLSLCLPLGLSPCGVAHGWTLDLCRGWEPCFPSLPSPRDTQVTAVAMDARLVDTVRLNHRVNECPLVPVVLRSNRPFSVLSGGMRPFRVPLIYSQCHRTG